MSGRLGMIAGLGELPVSLAEAADQEGREIYVLRLKGFEEPRLAEYPGDVVGFGEVGRQLRLLKAAGCRELVFAGRVARPDFRAIKLDWRGARLLPRVIRAARDGDDALLRVLVDTFAGEGFRVIGAEEVHGDLCAAEGLLAGPEPGPDHRADIARAMAVAGEIGRLDIGQGCVVCDGLVLAVEAQEGTDAMLERCARLAPEIRGTKQNRRGVLAKRPKPIQERRIDLPTIGVSTVERAAAAGLAGIAVEAGGALVMARREVEAAAARLGVFVIGIASDASDPVDPA
jgi:UDP-2,3-diacylglucosamine hydrolase